MSVLTDAIGGMWALLRLGIATRFSFTGPYWTWRMQTAFGRGMPESKLEMLVAVYRYAVWMHRMKSLR
ncbi:MAG: hypothetical protein AAF747_08710 [Planctomycetota bacterium]